MTALMAEKPARLSRDEQKAQRRANLLDAAWALFCETGYDDLSVDAIAERAGLSRMPVYSLFGDKQGLFFELWNHRSQNLANLFLAGCKPGADLTDNLTALAQTIAAADRVGDGSYGAALFYTIQGLSLKREDIREKVAALANDLIDRFAGMIASSRLPDGLALTGAPDLIARHVLAQINGAATVTFQTDHHFVDADQLAAIFIGIALTPSAGR